MDNNVFISKISNTKYNIHSVKDLRNFKKELLDNSITIEQYCDLYLINVAHKKHINKELKNNEKYVYKNIKLLYGTYEKIIVNKQLKCELCNTFYAASFPSFISHIKRHHKIKTLYDYFKKCNYTQLITEQVKCTFCNKQAFFKIQYDIKNKTFKKIYKRHFCQSLECKNNICLQYFEKQYKNAKKQFEHIGGKTEFLCKIYNTDAEGLKLIGKSKAAKHPAKWKVSLNGFIEKYGPIEGKIKYEERCKKISFRNTLQGLIDKYGKEIGTKKYFEKLEKISNFHKNNKKITTAGQLQLFNILNQHNEYLLQYSTTAGIIDIYNKDKNVVIQYYGDYWHCNPLYFKDTYYHKLLNMTAKEKHQFDFKRIQNIKKSLNNPQIIIVWQSSFKNIDKDIIKKQIQDFINYKNKGKILWI